MRRLLFASALLAACSSPDEAGPAPVDSGTTDGAEDTAPAVEHDDPCTSTAPTLGVVPSTRVATIVSKKRPQTASGVSPDGPPGLPGYLAAGLGEWEAGPAEPGLVDDTLLPGAGSSSAASDRRSVAFVLHVSDTQLVDDESPSRLMVLDNPITSGAGRPQEGGVARATSAMHRTLAAITKARPFDFELVTGDCADNAQANEHAWFVQLMDGKKGLDLDSGADDDPVVGPGNDWKDPFDPVPAPAPWYFVFGNHDNEVQGNSVPSAFTSELSLGTTPKSGTRDYRRKGAPITREEVPADPRRKQLTNAEIVAGLFDTASVPGPVGHGFTKGKPGTSYVVEPMPGVPLRLVSLDTTDPSGGSSGSVLVKTMTEFLEPTLAAAEKDGFLVILSSHHPTSTIDAGKGDDTKPDAAYLTREQVEKAVAAHPNVILWLAGHEHSHRISAIKGPSADAPGYYEIMTDAIADWPSQARAIELVWVPGDDSLSIYTSTIDYAAESCLEARFRTYSLVDVNSGWSPSGAGRPADRNVELRRKVPKGVKLAGLGKTKIETETTLVGK
ncbi:MAG: metallophosphoesterase [Myxococcales bacterium]|nr:metallophosphoesterase [Myxococcales bacterium]